jgi:hypothetical protein
MNHVRCARRAEFTGKSMRHRLVLSATATVLLLGTAATRTQDTPAIPAPTPPRLTPVNIVEMPNWGLLASFLNLAAGTVRVVAVLSPSAPESGTLMETVLATLSANPSRRLRAYVVLEGLGPADTQARALNLATNYREPRLTFLWDAGAVAAGTFRAAIGSGKEPAAGVCLLYDTGARFSSSAPAPALWMTVNPRLAGAALDRAELEARSGEMVRRVEAAAREAARTPRQ